MRLAVVTATLDFDRAASCVESWVSHTVAPSAYYLVHQGGRNTRQWQHSADLGRGNAASFYAVGGILGVVPAFALGVQKALEDGHEIIACLHDDLEIQERGWDETVSRLFKACPRAGLCGFGGGKGLGADEIYQTPYHPMQLARQGFRSNMRDAEAHGIRSRAAEPVACLDGFSQIGLASFWLGQPLQSNDWGVKGTDGTATTNLFAIMQSWGVIHHFYDGMLGCFAKRLGYQVWYLPIACHHYGGRTAVADPTYAEWANAKRPTGLIDVAQPSGDQIFWLEAHQIGYDQFRDVLPIRT